MTTLSPKPRIEMELMLDPIEIGIGHGQIIGMLEIDARKSRDFRVRAGHAQMTILAILRTQADRLERSYQFSAVFAGLSVLHLLSPGCVIHPNSTHVCDRNTTSVCSIYAPCVVSGVVVKNNYCFLN